MKEFWKKKSQEEIKSIVFSALERNINFEGENILGVPASFLEEKVFSQDTAFLSDAPFMSTLVQNPNHIGCHTLGTSEPFFEGTHDIERELIEICAVDILGGKPHAQDGYVTSGGTEANIQAIWIYRNYFMEEQEARREEICIVCNADSHYSMDKAANLLVLEIFKVPVDPETREISETGLADTLEQAKSQGKRHFILICNMMTTMFGSVDPVERYTKTLAELSCDYKLHVDAAYGGFYYPFSDADSQLTFRNPDITSFTLDAHKMAQAPYGTGIFVIRKGYMDYVNTRSASYVEGQDITLTGSRSGANAIAVWMILARYGPYGWNEKIFILQNRTDWMCDQLKQLQIQCYRHPKSNIIAVKSDFIPQESAHKFSLVPDSHSHPRWFKIVIMEHVTIEKLAELIERIKQH
jgi:glutamate/tyrosine decarboxylase-like PLP-dependent enzyme